MDRERQQQIVSAAERVVNGENIQRSEQQRDLGEIIVWIHNELPAIAASVIDTNKNPSLMPNPDDYLEHAPKWHQYGIITHSREFARAMREVIPDYVKEWGFEAPVDKVLSERIDGVEKRQLLEIASLLHDIGKFTARKAEHKPGTDEISYDFKDHADHSGDIIRSKLHDTLKSLQLTNAQIAYVAHCAELHFELGNVRNAAKENGGYTMAFVDTPAFHEAARQVIEKHPDFALEIGLMFIADGLSKSEVAAQGATDAEIADERPALEQELATRELNPKLIDQAMQMPVNLKIARMYLSEWATNQAL